MILYKYRNLANLKRLLEIIIDKKMYAPRYKELNDPMEGYFTYTKDVYPYRKEINSLKEEALICSFSKSNLIGMMWIMYADEGKGCCLELEIGKNTWDCIDVDYCLQIPKIDNPSKINIKTLFGYKSSIWEYEQEVRYIKRLKKRLKLPVRVKKVYLGYAFDESSNEYKFYKKLFGKFDVEVDIISKNKINFGYL
jgi:hypothetical protein